MNDNKNPLPEDFDPFEGGPFSKPGPFANDVIETPKNSTPQKGEKPLSEENFIHESSETAKVVGVPLWIWLAVIALMIALIWGSLNWFQGLSTQEIKSKPFLEVTNRDISLFLWQFPEFMRSHAKQKTGYLPGFQYVEKETMELAKTEEFASAPPAILFLYHTWNRLLASDFIDRPVPNAEFVEFLEVAQEWSPQYWKKAPADYVQLIDSGSYRTIENLQKVLPLDVRRAFQGWKNYFKEGPAINEMAPTYSQVTEFLKKHPSYARNYWRNIQEVEGREVAGEHYLFNLKAAVNDDDKIPKEQLAPFLKVALYNSEQASKNL